MRILATFAAASAVLALAACGSSDQASEQAVADTVEMPADEAMSEAPMPAAAEVDTGTGAFSGAAEEASQSVEEEADQDLDAVGAEAEAAASEVEAATQAAEEAM